MSQTNARPIVSRVDHLMIRAEDPRPLLEVLSGTLGLPVIQPVTTFPGFFTNAVVSAGSAFLELIRFGPLPEPSLAETSARLWGLAFEPAASLVEVQRELKTRKIPQAAPQVFERPDLEGGWQSMWTTLSVSMLEHTRKARAAFFAQRLLGGLWRKQMRRMAEAARQGEEVRGMDERRLDSMNGVIGHGWVFFSEFDPRFADPAKIRTASREALREARGGTLGVDAVSEVVVGSTDVETARERWRKFFAPTPEAEPGLWQPGGPAVRIVPHHKNRPLSLVLKVPSLARTRTFLEDREMLGEATEDRVKIAPATVGGLDFWLVE